MAQTSPCVRLGAGAIDHRLEDVGIRDLPRRVRARFERCGTTSPLPRAALKRFRRSQLRLDLAFVAAGFEASRLGSATSGTRYLLTPTMVCSPAIHLLLERPAPSRRRCCCARPASTAAYMPPAASMRAITAQDLRLHLVGQRLHVVGAAQRIDDVGQVRFLLEDVLRGDRDARAAFSVGTDSTSS